MGSKSNSSKRLLTWVVEAGIVVLLMVGTFPHAGAGEGVEEVRNALLLGLRNVDPVELEVRNGIKTGINYRTEAATSVFTKKAATSPNWGEQIEDIKNLVKQAVIRLMYRPFLVRLFCYEWVEGKSKGERVSSVLLLAIRLPPLPDKLNNLHTKTAEVSKQLSTEKKARIRKPFEGCSKFSLEVVVEAVGRKLLETQVVQFEDGKCKFGLVILVGEQKKERKEKRRQAVVVNGEIWEEEEMQQKDILGGHIYKNVFPQFSDELQRAQLLELLS